MGTRASKPSLRVQPPVLFVLVTLSTVVAPRLAAAQLWEVGNRAFSDQNGFGGMTEYGEVLATGDFDGDGAADPIVGAPQMLAHNARTGFVGVRRGGPDRELSGWFGYGVDSYEFLQTGRAVAAGDFDNDGRDELAFGEPGADLILTVEEHWTEAGRVRLRSWDGARWVDVGRLYQIDAAPLEQPESFDWFGAALAVGDFDGDSYDDLAVGVPGEDLEAGEDAGLVHVFFGGPSGLRTDNSRVYAAGVAGISGQPSAGDRFGQVLAVGDFDGENMDDLVIGVPERSAGATRAGQVHVLYRPTPGTGVPPNQLFSDADLPGAGAEAFDRFGAALAAGDFGPDLTGARFADLAIGVPGQAVAAEGHLVPVPGAGKAVVLYGGAEGLHTIGATQLTQLDVPGAHPEIADRFGAALAAGTVGGFEAAPEDLLADLAVGVPGEDGDETGHTDEGRVHLFFGSDQSLGAGYPVQDVAPAPHLEIGAPAADDRFGQALTIGDFDRDGWGDLAIGVPGKDFEGRLRRGAVQVLYGALFADGLESGGTTFWSSTEL